VDLAIARASSLARRAAIIATLRSASSSKKFNGELPESGKAGVSLLFTHDSE